MQFFVYEISPIDFGWDNLRTVEETAVEMGTAEARRRLSPNDMTLEDPELGEFIAAWESAQQAASERGWEGDFRHPPKVFWIPVESTFAVGFVFKHDNNGTTYVLSPVPLDHLRALE